MMGSFGAAFIESLAAETAGADDVLLYPQTNFEAETKRLTAAKGVDVVSARNRKASATTERTPATCGQVCVIL